MNSPQTELEFDYGYGREHIVDDANLEEVMFSMGDQYCMNSICALQKLDDKTWVYKVGEKKVKLRGSDIPLNYISKGNKIPAKVYVSYWWDQLPRLNETYYCAKVVSGSGHHGYMLFTTVQVKELVPEPISQFQPMSYESYIASSRPF